MREIRVHGVAGTPPEAMLDTDPIIAKGEKVPGDPKYIKLFRAPPVGENLRAYHWGGMTAEDKLNALWLLLLPFALANVAGFAVSAGKLKSRLAIFLARLAGLILTMLLVALALNLAVDLVWHADAPRWLLALGTMAVVGFVLGLALLSTRSHWSDKNPKKTWAATLKSCTQQVVQAAPNTETTPGPAGPAGEDPAGRLGVADAEMWTSSPVTDLLRTIHLAASLYLVSVITGSMRRGRLLPAEPVDLVEVLLPPVAILIVLALIGSNWHRRLPKVASVLVAVTGALYLVELVRFLASPLSESVHAPGLHDLTFVAVAALALVSGFFALAARSWTGAGSLVLAGITGGSLGAGLAVAGFRALDENPPNGIEWMAVATMMGLLVGVALASFLLFSKTVDTGSLAKSLRWLSGHGDWALAGLALAGVVAVVGIAGVRSQTSTLPSAAEFNGWLGPVTFGLVAFPPALLAMLWFTRRQWRRALLVLGGLVIAALVVPRLPATEILNVPVRFDQPNTLAVVAVIMLPATFIVGRMLSGWKEVETRRGIGILWDILGYWPRWFHPLAPPAYGPYVVEKLGEMLEEIRTEVTVIGAHSQGSVLVANALLKDPEPQATVGLVTYGCPLGYLYGKLFPAYYHRQVFDEVAVRVQGRWLNLWRDSDPIGGATGLEAVDRGPVEIRHKRIHSDYEMEPEYQAAVQEVTPA